MKKLTPTPTQKPLIKRTAPFVAGVLLASSGCVVVGEPVGEPALEGDAGEPGGDGDADAGN